jgi:VanZ family protein
MSSRIVTKVKSGRGRRLLAWLAVLAWAGLIFFVSAQPKETFQRLGFTGQALSVGGHLIVYFVLMILLVLAQRASTKLSNKQVYLVAFLIVAIYGLSDEYHQSFVPGRTPTLVDWIVDLVGAGLALLVLLRWERRLESPRHRLHDR